eukprot:9966306-Karenia_brevis.AAC.1
MKVAIRSQRSFVIRLRLDHGLPDGNSQGLHLQLASAAHQFSSQVSAGVAEVETGRAEVETCLHVKAHASARRPRLQPRLSQGTARELCTGMLAN